MIGITQGGIKIVVEVTAATSQKSESRPAPTLAPTRGPESILAGADRVGRGGADVAAAVAVGLLGLFVAL